MDYFKKGTAESNAKGKARSRTPRTRNPMFADDDDDDDDPDVAGSPPPLGQARGQSALDRRPMTQFGRNLAASSDSECPPALMIEHGSTLAVKNKRERRTDDAHGLAWHAPSCGMRPRRVRAVPSWPPLRARLDSHALRACARPAQ